MRVTGAAYLESYFQVWFGDQVDNPYAPITGIGSPLPNATSPGSGAPRIPDPWSTVLKDLKGNVERLANAKFNMIHLTYLIQ